MSYVTLSPIFYVILGLVILACIPAISLFAIKAVVSISVLVIPVWLLNWWYYKYY
jgi:hypothetical protein